MVKQYQLDVTKYVSSSSEYAAIKKTKAEYITRKGILNYLWMNGELTSNHYEFLWTKYNQLPELERCILEFREIFIAKNMAGDDGHIYTGKFSITVANLKQIHQATQEDIDSGLRDWARLFQATTWEEMLMIAENNNFMQSFTFSLKELSDDEKAQMQCEAKEHYEHDKASFIQQGFDDGIQQGIQQEHEKTEKAQQRAEAAEAELCRLRAELGKK